MLKFMSTGFNYQIYSYIPTKCDIGLLKIKGKLKIMRNNVVDEHVTP